MRYCFLSCVLLICAAQVQAQQPPVVQATDTGVIRAQVRATAFQQPPVVQAMDTPNDSGGSITVTWDFRDFKIGRAHV